MFRNCQNEEEGRIFDSCCQFGNCTRADGTDQSPCGCTLPLTQQAGFPRCVKSTKRWFLGFWGDPRPETTRKKGSFGVAASWSIVLGTMTENNDTSHAAIHCLNLLLLNFTTLVVQIGQKCRFRRVRTAKTTTMLVSFEGPATGSIVLDTMAETNKPLLDTFHCFSQLQSNFTTLAKPRLFPTFSTLQRPNEEEEMIFEARHQPIDCTLGDV